MSQNSIDNYSYIAGSVESTVHLRDGDIIHWTEIKITNYPGG